MASGRQRVITLAVLRSPRSRTPQWRYRKSPRPTTFRGILRNTSSPPGGVSSATCRQQRVPVEVRRSGEGDAVGRGVLGHAPSKTPSSSESLPAPRLVPVPIPASPVLPTLCIAEVQKKTGWSMVPTTISHREPRRGIVVGTGEVHLPPSSSKRASGQGGVSSSSSPPRSATPIPGGPTAPP
jgi:hypothetical protein